MIWILFLIALWGFSILSIGKIINLMSHEELDKYVNEVNQRVRKSELERLSKLPTKSRIKFKPDI